MTEHTRDRKLAPPGCCEDPEDSDRRQRIRYHARSLEQAAASDPRALAHARAQLELDLLAADVALGERRADALECGIECLGEDIERARKFARRL